MHIQIKRAYEKPDIDDGTRVLVDRLWPRGVLKSDLAIDEWAKHLAPSAALREWFDHTESKFTEFSKRYRTELTELIHERTRLQAVAQRETLTLVYAARDPVMNNAAVLRDWLLAK